MGKELFSEELKLATVQYVLEGHTLKEASEKYPNITICSTFYAATYFLNIQYKRKYFYYFSNFCNTVRFRIFSSVRFRFYHFIQLPDKWEVIILSVYKNYNLFCKKSVSHKIGVLLFF